MNEKIGGLIRARREAAGWRLEDLAQKLEITISALSKIEGGHQRVDSEMLVKLADIFNLSLDDLLNRVEKKVQSQPLTKLANPRNITDDLLYVIDNYIQAKKEEFGNHSLGLHVRNKVKKTLYDEAALDSEIYHVVGSVGQGQWAEVPWVCIFNRDITLSATRGYYIVFLFKADGSGVYLSLNQGWTYFKEKYGTKKGRVMIQRTASIMRKNLHTVLKHLNLTRIDLKGRGPLATGYELGHICGTYYNKNDFPSSSKIIEDLLNLLIVYSEIETFKGSRSVEELNDYLLMEEDGVFLEVEEREESFQNDVQDQSVEVNYEEPDDKKQACRPPNRNQEGKEIYGRRAFISAAALKEASYMCIADPTHKTFTSKATGEQYVEAHHIIPMSKQGEFEYELDQKANIAALCPNCHRLIHQGADEEREELLRTLFYQRRDRIEKIGIEITFSQLKEFYNFD